MFNLEKSISEWRGWLAASGIRAGDVLDELENHLREDIKQQTGTGATLDKAFEIAVGRVGEANALKAEFAKAGKVRGALEKLMITICIVLVSCITGLSCLTAYLCYPRVTDRIVALVAMVCTLAVACYWSRAVRFLPVIPHKGIRTAAALACIVAGFGIATFWAQVILPHFAGPIEGQIPAVGVWFMLPIALGFGLGCGLDLAARRPVARSAS